MKKFEKLSKSEMKNVLGGVAAKQSYNCQCTGTAGTWTGSYSSSAAATAVASVYCSQGGTCTLAN